MATSQRINLWKGALMIIKDFPIFGTGLNTYTIVAPKYALTAETGIYAYNRNCRIGLFFVDCIRII
jgi:O-antigen ligase